MPPPRKNPRTRKPRCAKKRSPTRRSKPCSKSSPRKSATWRRCDSSNQRTPEPERRTREPANRRTFMNIQQMMKQAQQMQERLQKQMAELRVEGNAGGGMVTVVVNGAKQVQSLKIDPEVVSKDDVEMLQDLILAALNDAHRKADEAISANVGGMLPPGLKIPGL